MYLEIMCASSRGCACFFLVPSHFLLAGMWIRWLQLVQHIVLRMVEPQDRRSQGPGTVECQASIPLPASKLLLYERNILLYCFHHCYFKLHSLQLNSVSVHRPIIPFMWKYRKHISVCISIGWIRLWYRNPQDNFP